MRTVVTNMLHVNAGEERSNDDTQRISFPPESDLFYTK